MKSLLALLASLVLASGQAISAAKPNIIIIFTDDQGYGDLGYFGSTTIRTPHFDRLAKEGRRFTSSDPKRGGMHKGVIFPASTTGLNPSEHTTRTHSRGHDV